MNTEIKNEKIARPWSEAYRAAVLETDHCKLADKLDPANVALWERLLEISSTSDHAEERQRLMDALLTIDMIRRIELKVPAR
jgi:hypothetical protein